jgi:tetratricopeptide (TPR) repeat protein
MMKRTISILLIVLTACAIQAQSKKAYVEAANVAYLDGDYYNALSFYLEALEFDTSDVYVMYRIAEAARHFESYSIAYEQYANVLARDNEGGYPLASFWLGMMTKMGGGPEILGENYEEAKRLFELYISEHEGDDEYYTALANKEISACDWGLVMIDRADEDVTVNHLGEEINTIYSEFGAVLEDEGITFSSMRFKPAGKPLIPVKNISKILRYTAGQPVTEYAEGLNSDTVITAHLSYNFNDWRAI